MRIDQFPAWTVGRLGGIPIRADVTFVVVPIALLLAVRWVWLIAGGFAWERIGVELVRLVIGLAGVVLSILAHELAHAIVARRYAAPVHEIRIGGFYGFASIGASGLSRAARLHVLAAGPAANALIALWLWMLLGFPSIDAHLYIGGSHAATVIGGWAPARAAGAWLLAVNLGMTLFNLLPAFPLDGGRITHLLLGRRLTARHARTVVAALGLLVGFWALLGAARYGATLATAGVVLIYINTAVLRNWVTAPD